MAPTIILVRHAQALHNVEKDYSIHDPELSDLGREQCEKLRENLVPRLRDLNVGLIIVSPMKRTIQTALLAFPELIKQGVPIVAHAGWQENSTQPCDTGTPPSLLVPLFPRVNFGRVDPIFPDKTSALASVYSHTRPAVLARGQAVLNELRARPESAVVVVSHAGFLRLGVTGRYFMNADYRIFDFVDDQEGGGGEEGGGVGEGIKLRLWEGMEAGGMGWSWDHTVPLGEGLPDHTEEVLGPKEPPR